MTATRRGSPFKPALLDSLKDRLVTPVLRALRSGASLPTCKAQHTELFELADAVLALPRQGDVKRDAPELDHAPILSAVSQLLH